ncbi:MAG: hypothetical protein QNJ38_04895 [Prochloraceae cyanobacterium]|nr:hypothetical protein [Prochloraceae cyanobacterium]
MMQKKLKLNFSLAIPIATLAGLFYFCLSMLQTNINSSNTNCTQSNPEEDRSHVNSPWQC